MNNLRPGNCSFSQFYPEQPRLVLESDVVHVPCHPCVSFPSLCIPGLNHPFRWSVADLRCQERLYAAATFFVAAAIEIIVHLFVAAHGASFSGFGIGIGAVVAAGNLFPLTITLITWSSMYHPTWIISRRWWWPSNFLVVLATFSYLDLVCGCPLYL